MIFRLRHNKVATNEKGYFQVFVPAGDYEVLRLFDKDRIIIKVSQSNRKQITLVKLEDGRLMV